MTDHEKRIIKESIEAYQRMIDRFQSRINELRSKITTGCCQEVNNNYKLKIKRIQ
jgi:hypothetical protein